MHAADSAGTPNARFLANAFVTLGLYYQEGIPGTLKPDSNHAREMFQFAASYFADPEAQYHLARLYLSGKGAPKDAMTAARWLQLSAEKGDHRAQAVLGSMPFKGEQVSRQAPADSLPSCSEQVFDNGPLPHNWPCARVPPP